MATEAQATANRANAQFSTGPTTEQGKQKSAANSTKHGFSAQNALIPGEDPAEFDQLLQSFRDYYGTQGSAEENLVVMIVQNQWKLNRLALIECVILGGSLEEMENSVFASFLCGGIKQPMQAIYNMQRYEAPIRRAFLQYTNSLRALIKDRHAREAKDRKEAAQEAELNRRKGVRREDAPTPEHNETKPNSTVAQDSQ